MTALAAALARMTAAGRDTSRDARLSLLGRIGELGQAADAAALASYLNDFDPKHPEIPPRLFRRAGEDRQVVVDKEGRLIVDGGSLWTRMLEEQAAGQLSGPDPNAASP